MRKSARLLVAAMTIATTLAVAAPPGASAGPDRDVTSRAPRWVRHVRNYPGGISNGVRASLSKGVIAARARYASSLASRPLGFGGTNVQMNADSNPPFPQDETSVAFNATTPTTAVAGANDYVSGGFALMRTTDGGNTWGTFLQEPQFSPTGEPCVGSDPWIAYSVRDQAFYAVTLCFFHSLPFSEVQVWESVDNGQTWTPGRLASVAASNYNYKTGKVKAAAFLDNNEIVVDNNPSSPHYGRIYVTYVKFHMLKNGFSDFCPAQLAYTDSIPANNPQKAVWSHTPIVPDNPGDDGIGPTANQWARPQVEKNGNLDIAYVSEDCNTGIDRALYLQKSADGGASFLPQPVRIDKPGEFVDNPSKTDLLGSTAFRAPLSPSLNYNQATGTLAYVYQNNLDRATSGANISLQVSHDGGLTWSDQKYISVNPDGTPAAGDQFFPSIASDSAGKYYVVFFDRRLDPANHNIDTFEAQSSDDGATWTNIRISTASWNPDQSFFDCGCFIGDYNGIAASTTVVYPVWTDGRSSAFAQTGIGETDIFTDVERP